jgi:hypothetical protein
MTNSPVEIVRLQSVILTREKQLQLETEFDSYAKATNFVIKSMLKQHLTKSERAFEVLEESFRLKHDRRAEYLLDVIKTARAEIARHRRIARAVRSMRDKGPFYKPGRMILSQPIVIVGDSALLLKMKDRSQLPVPYDKRSRNREAEALLYIVKGETEEGNKRYERVRMTLNKEGFIDIDIRTRIAEMRSKN